MKKYKKTFILFVIALLFISLHSRSDNINHSDADYCIDWGGDKTEFNINKIRLVFVKKK